MKEKISIMAIILALMMVMMTTVVPHHHHCAMICMAKEICKADGCCNDKHTCHSDEGREEGGTHCVAEEKYAPSATLRIHFEDPGRELLKILPILATLAAVNFGGVKEAGIVPTQSFKPLSPPWPPLSAAATNAPPAIV